MKNKIFKKALSVFTAMAMMFSLMTGIPFSELGLGITANAASASTPILEGKRVYANGTPITIEAGSSSSTASVWYMNGSTKTYVAQDVSDAVIYGGYYGESLDSDTNITMTGGSVYAIYGSGYSTDCSKGSVNNVNISISGGTVSYGVYASYQNWVKGNVNITVTGGNIRKVCGCTLSPQSSAGDNQEYCKVSGNASVTITGGTVEGLRIGNGLSPVNGTKTGIVTIPGVTLDSQSSFTATSDYDNLYISDGTTFVVKGNVTLPENTKLIIPSGKTLSLNSYTKVEAPYGIENNGTLNIESGCTTSYNIENNGTLNISTPYENSEGIVNNGTINLTKPILGDKPTGNGTINRNTAYISGISSVSSISVKMDDADYALANGYYETADGKLYLWLPSGYAVVFVDGSVYCGTANEGTAVKLLAYKAVADIETVSSRIPVGINYNLSTYAVTNNDATYKTIEWSVVNANGTGATITDNAIKATAAGTATIRATVNNGQAYGTAYTKEYEVTFYVTDGIDISLGSITISKKDDTTITVAGAGISNGSKDYPVDESIRIFGSKTSNTITITDGTTVNLILTDVKIDVSGTEGATPLYVNSNAQLNLTLEGTNELKGGKYAAALGVPSGAKLVIEESSTGTLEATGYSGGSAGIGGGRGNGSGTITINGGTITAICNSGWGAGIGGGNGGSGGTTTINGGIVIARGHYTGAGIGGGHGGSGGTVTINGGTVTATGYIGIGNGDSASGGTLKITGGNISGTYNITPTDGSNEVSCYTCKFIGDSEDMAGKTVTAITLENGGTYGLKDVVTFDGGSENEGYFNCYLPAGSKITSITVGGTTYNCRAEDGTCYVEHTWEDATCTIAEHCSVCDKTRGETLSHNYVDGVCTICSMDRYGTFHIKTAEQLVAFAQYVKAGNKDADAVLDADIDMTGVAWTPICRTVSYHSSEATDTGYTGTFDGKGHTISNLTVTGIAGATYSYGLFGTVSGTVENLGMVNYIYTMGSATDARAGSIAGQVLTGGTITNCYSVGHSITTSNNIAGGIAGCNYGGTISNCYALNGSVSGYDTRWGGVVGDSKKDDSAPDQAQTYGTVSNCYTDDTRVVSSQNDNGSITSCAVKDDAAFASGEIAYLLNGSSSENVTWYQTLETDTYPVLNREHGKVYSVFKCDGTTPVYRNVNENEPHTDNNSDGECDVCGGNAHIHEWTYTASNNTITAECGAADCPATGTNTIVISASGKTYDGTPVTATVINNVDKTDYSSSIVYKDSEGNVVTEAVNVGRYTANLTVGGVTASCQFEITKATPTAEMFTCTSSAVYDGTEKSASVVARNGITGVGEITNIKYYQNDIEVAPVNVGTYTVKIDVAEGDIYDAATDIEVGTFEITKANAVITWNDQSVSSTGKEAELTAPTLTFIGNDNPEVELTYSYKVQGDAEYTVGLPTACGIYDVKVNVSATDNYNAVEDTMVLTITCTDADNNGICDYCGMYEAPERVDEYYQITNAGNLMWFVSQVNAGRTTINAKLTADINMKDIDWTTMSSFAGTFDGNGYTISYLCADGDGGDDDVADGSRCGLIQTLSEGGKVTGLTISDAQLWSAHSAGAIAAVNNGTISKCIVKDSSIMLGASHGLAAIAGTNNGTITDCGAINCFLQRRWGAANSGSYAIGAIAEDNNGTVSNCFSYGCRFSNTPKAYAIVESGNAPVNCYYYTGNTVSDTVATAKTADQFASGEVAYLLNGSSSENVTWYQTLETDTYPVLDSKHGKVYSVFKCDGETPAGYSNVNEPVHDYTHTVVPPTYYEQGYTLHECDNCDYSYKDNYTDKLAIAITNPSRSTTAIRINWNKIDTAIGYVIEQFDGENWIQIVDITDNATVTYKVTDLTPGTAYKFRMFAYNDESRSDYTEELAVNTDMTTVKGFTSPSRSTSAIRLNWSKNAYATGYVIDQYTNSGWIQIADITDSEITTYKVTGLKSGTAYKFRMKAYSVTENGEIIYGNKTATLTVNTQSSTVKGFDLKSRSSTALRLKWTKNTAVDGYIIEQMIDGVWTEIADIDDYKTTEYKVTGLEASTSYSFRMKSYSITKYGDRTYSTYTSVLDKTTNPSAVSGLRVKSRSDKAIRLAWKANASAGGYLIEQYIDGNWVQIADVADGSVTEYKVTGLASATEYQFRVRSYNMDDETALYSEYKTVSGVTL